MNYMIYAKIPLWVNIMQAILILIMLGQVYMYFFNHEILATTGVNADSVPMLNLVYEMGARTLVMALVSIVVMISQDPKVFLVILLMNILREGFETIIDPMYPVLNAPGSPTVDFWIHIAILLIEIAAFVTVFKIWRSSIQNNKDQNLDSLSAFGLS